MGIDSATAKKMIAAAETQAIAQKAHGAIAIVDAVNGDLVSFLRMDGATQVAVVSAEGKARAALLFGVSTKVISDSIKAGKPVPLLITTPAVAGGIWGRMVNVSTNEGGMLIHKDGKIIGAIGVGGAGGGELDERAALAGLNALSAK
jgi:glc operon protein GlcG